MFYLFIFGNTVETITDTKICVKIFRNTLRGFLEMKLGYLKIASRIKMFCNYVYRTMMLINKYYYRR